MSFLNLANNHINPEPLYTFPEEGERHEGTWLQWPHHYQYGKAYRNSIESTWIAMTKALVEGEKVHIIAYNDSEKRRIVTLLEDHSIKSENIDFFIHKTDDVWVRDNGPIFVRNKKGNLAIQDWGFNAWGQKIDEDSGLHIQFENSNSIPSKLAKDLKLELVDLKEVMINEGGSIEMDGNGTLMACKSSILNSNRNPGMSQTEAERIFRRYLGVSHFIWLEGQKGLEITDQHIDGFARFGNTQTIITMELQDLLEYDIKQSDIELLFNAKNRDGIPYEFLKIPLTKNNVRKTNGKTLGFKGSYINYYIANKVVLVPNHNDPNDSLANKRIQAFYPKRKVVGIDVRNLVENGGMVHCVTQQQPL